MTKQPILITITLIVLAAGCSSELPRPPGAGWFTCPHCQGAGKLAFVGKPGGQGMLGGKTRDEHLIKPGILDELAIQSFAHLDGDKSKMDDYDRDGLEKKSDAIKNEMDKINLTNDSGSKVRYRKCNTCNGIGWVK